MNVDKAIEGVMVLTLQAAAATNKAISQGLLAASSAAEKLRANLRSEQETFSAFLASVQSIVKPLQGATAVVQARPDSTDVCWLP